MICETLERRTTSLTLDFPPKVGRSAAKCGSKLLITWQAISIKAEESGLIIHYGIHNTPMGIALIATTTQGLCNLYFLETAEASLAERLLRQAWHHADIRFDPVVTQCLSDQIFMPNSGIKDESLPLWVKGTQFQLQVWQALLSIPFGEKTTYHAIANQIGRPSAARAVGNAIGNNPIAYLIPCHRVIRESGELGGYRWGLDRKRSILDWEASSL